MLGPRARQLCLWVSQGLGTKQVRSLAPRSQTHSLALRGFGCVQQGHTLHRHRSAIISGSSLLFGDGKEHRNKRSSLKYKKKVKEASHESAAFTSNVIVSLCQYTRDTLCTSLSHSQRSKK